ncbi:MAG: hypothetical protein WAO55_16460 [Candidatus Manganitrophaceae bacterium]
MRRNGKILLILLAYLLSAWFILDPGPLPMALFVFIAQPFIALAAVLYIVEVLRELKQRGVL